MSRPPALQGAVQHAQTWAQAHPGHVVIVVLVTDGQPNICGSDPDARIVTYVIGITAQGQSCFLDQNPPNEADLNAVAMAGGSDRAFLVDTGVGDAVKQFFDAVSTIQAKTALPCEYVLPQASGMGKVDSRFVMILDIDKVFTSDELSTVSECDLAA